MTEFDYAVVFVVAVSVAIGIWRGLIREAFSLAGWILAFVVANAFGSDMASMLRGTIHTESVRLIAAFVLLFVIVLLAMGIAGMLASKLFRVAGLGLADRFLGAIFGMARGIVVVLIAVLLAGFTALPKEPAWRNALLSQPLETAVIAAKPWLPREVAERVRYK
jgi:membrane protein required for colicin V production